MKFIVPVITAILAAALVFYFFNRKIDEANKSFSLIELKEAQLSVEKNLQEKLNKIDTQLNAFSSTISSDRNFSLRLFVENDKSSPDITEKAQQFLNPMGFSLLEITDSSYNILSSGHFPASAGNSDSLKASVLTEQPAIFEDEMMGSKVITIQAKKQFKIADIPFYALGGLEINDEFLKDLTPRDGVKVLFKLGDRISGMSGINSLSEINNGVVIINNREYNAACIDLPYKGEGPAPVLIILIAK